MDVQLDPELQRFINDQVRAGRYGSADDVVNEAVSRLRTEDELLGQELDDEEIAAIENGLSQLNRGEGRPWTDVRAELKARYLSE
jgi:antitoxin ParD1/3/4